MVYTCIYKNLNNWNKNTSCARWIKQNILKRNIIKQKSERNSISFFLKIFLKKHFFSIVYCLFLCFFFLNLSFHKEFKSGYFYWMLSITNEWKNSTVAKKYRPIVKNPNNFFINFFFILASFSAVLVWIYCWAARYGIPHALVKVQCK